MIQNFFTGNRNRNLSETYIIIAAGLAVEIAASVAAESVFCTVLQHTLIHFIGASTDCVAI